MATSVRVVCRFRPAAANEIALGSTRAVSVTDSSIQITGETNETDRQYHFDRCFDSNATQAQVFNDSAKAYVKQVFNGYNCTLFAYGQTGSGKSHTMMGGQGESAGIIPRLVESIFEGIENADEALEFTVKLSYCEIYNEKIRDLLTTEPGSDNLKIRDGPRGIYIENVTECYVASHADVLQMMALGSSHRAVSSTQMNSESSRSHSVFMITLGQVDRNTGTKKGSKLTLVDLAGSEKVQKTGAAGSTLKEAQHINKSLSALGNVINALTTASAHVPYRDSKLTRLLSDSLGGNSCTCLIITASPMQYNIDETVSTLRFGTRAKLIKNKPTVNQEKSVSEYKRLLALSEDQSKVQQEIIAALESDVDTLVDFIRGNKLIVPVLSGVSSQSGNSIAVHMRPLSEVTDMRQSMDSDDSENADLESESLDTLSSPKSLKHSLKPVEEEKEETPTDKQSAFIASRGASRRGSQSDLATLPARFAAMSAQLAMLQGENSNLRDRVSENELEMAEANEIHETEKDIVVLQVKDLLGRLESESAQRATLQVQAREVELLKKQLEFRDREHGVVLSDMRDEKRQMGEKVSELLKEMEHMKQQIAQLTLAKTESSTSQCVTAAPVIPSRALDTDLHVTSFTASPLPDSKPFMKKMSLSMMKSKTMKRGDLQRASMVADALSGLDLIKDDGAKIDMLTEALTQKVTQHSKLKEQHSCSLDHISMLEVALAESNTKIHELNANSQRIKDLEEKLSTAENLVERLMSMDKQRSKPNSTSVSVRHSRQVSSMHTSAILHPHQSHIVVPLMSKKRGGRAPSMAHIESTGGSDFF